MKKLKNMLLVKIVLILIIILLSLIIIKECKILGFCYTMMMLLSPLLFGYVIAWLLKPIMLYFNKYFNLILSSTLTFLLVAGLAFVLGYYGLPIIIKEVKGLVNFCLNMYAKIDPNLLKNVDVGAIGSKVLSWLNGLVVTLKNLVLNSFYSLFVAFFFLVNHREVSNLIASKVPTDLICELSDNLRSYVRGTLIDTLILLAMSILVFYVIKLPYFLLFAILISVTNIIPYIGPYIGGLPGVLVAFGINPSLGFTVLAAVILLQLVESSFIQPYIMSKVLKLNELLIMFSLIVCGYFFGVMGMLISTPILSVIKTLYEYNKVHHFIRLPALGK